MRASTMFGLALVGVTACAPGARPADEGVRPDARQTAFTTRIDVLHADRFSVEYREAVAVVRLRAPLVSWSKPGEAETRTDTVVVVPAGADLPRLEGELGGAVVIHAPAARVATNAEADDAIVRALGAADRLVAVGGTTTYDDDLRQRVERGEVGQVGYTWHSAPNLEVLVSRRPDVLFMRLVNLDQAEALGRVRALGIPAVPSFAWAEQTYLGALEWIKLFGLILGREAEATAYFNRIAARVESLKALAAAQSSRPAILWAYYGGGQQWIAYHRGVEEQFVVDAGARSAVADIPLPWRDGGTVLATEQLRAVAADADLWIIGDTHAVSAPGGMSLPPEPVLRLFRPWREKRLYHNYRRRKPQFNAFDWYETHPLRPDLVLADLLAMAHPSALPDHELHFFGTFEPEARR